MLCYISGVWGGRAERLEMKTGWFIYYGKEKETHQIDWHPTNSTN
jgi:hypothetical protein